MNPGVKTPACYLLLWLLLKTKDFPQKKVKKAAAARVSFSSTGMFFNCVTNAVSPDLFAGSSSATLIYSVTKLKWATVLTLVRRHLHVYFFQTEPSNRGEEEPPCRIYNEKRLLISLLLIYDTNVFPSKTRVENKVKGTVTEEKLKTHKVKTGNDFFPPFLPNSPSS